ncbi:MAG: hypothetical protein RL755_431 [Pseudomonadota bacterium]
MFYAAWSYHHYKKIMDLLNIQHKLHTQSAQHTIIYSLCLFLSTFSAIYAQAPQSFEIQKNERLLVLAPHPDDESLSSAGLAHRILINDGAVRSVVITAGDAYVEAIEKDTGRKNLKPTDFLKYGEIRLEESRRAAKILGNGLIHLDLLGFSDGSIYDMLVSHWRTHPEKSEFTGFSHVPYRIAEDKGVAQDGKVLHDELIKILNETKPTLIVFPDVMENDSDHAGLGMFALLAIHDWLNQKNSDHKKEPRLLTYLIHWQHGWPAGSDSAVPLNLSNSPLFLPDDLPLRGHQRACFNLNVIERNLKHNALAQYNTQQRAMGDFLAAFVRSNECFTVLNVEDSRDIKNVVLHWQSVRKLFDDNPSSRARI